MWHWRLSQTGCTASDLGDAAAAAGGPSAEALPLVRVGGGAIQPESVLLGKREAGETVAAVAARVRHRVARQLQARQPPQPCRE